jgi:hypothetical protein
VALKRNNMKQTAVEWLENQIMTSKYFYKLMEDINSRSTVAQPNIFRQAKELEKNRMIEFHKWMIENDTVQNAEKHFHFTDSDMLNEYYNEKEII